MFSIVSSCTIFNLPSLLQCLQKTSIVIYTMSIDNFTIFYSGCLSQLFVHIHCYCLNAKLIIIFELVLYNNNIIIFWFNQSTSLFYSILRLPVPRPMETHLPFPVGLPLVSAISPSLIFLVPRPIDT